jgi:hypothetical protein
MGRVGHIRTGSNPVRHLAPLRTSEAALSRAKLTQGIIQEVRAYWHKKFSEGPERLSRTTTNVGDPHTLTPSIPSEIPTPAWSQHHGHFRPTSV